MNGRLAALSVALLAVAVPAAAEPVDHIMLGVADLDRGIAEVEHVTGARMVRGGSHPGAGTRNALMSLGDGTYLELLAPDPAQSSRAADFAFLKALALPRPVGWAVRSDDLTGLAARLEARGIRVNAQRPGARTLPDGTRLEWTTLTAAISNPRSPFFVAWRSMATHPSRTAPAGCRLAGLAVTATDAPKLDAIVRLLALPVEVRPAGPARIAVTLDCPRGRVVF